MATPLPMLVITPYQWVQPAVAQYKASHVISILGDADGMPWPLLGESTVLRLPFDDTPHSTKYVSGPTPQQIRSLIGFAREWGGRTSLVVHCRAGVSRSPAAALIVAAAIGRRDLFAPILAAKSYFRPNRRMLELAAKLLAHDELKLLKPADNPRKLISEWGIAAIPL